MKNWCRIDGISNVPVVLNRLFNSRLFKFKCLLQIFVWCEQDLKCSSWRWRPPYPVPLTSLFIISSAFPRAVLMPAKSISSLLWMIFLSLEFTGVTNSAVIWENSSQLVSVSHLHYYHCNLPSLSHFLFHSTCYHAVGFLLFGHTTLSILFRADSYASPYAHVGLWLKCFDMAKRSAPGPCRLLICPLLIQRSDHAFTSSWEVPAYEIRKINALGNLSLKCFPIGHYDVVIFCTYDDSHMTHADSFVSSCKTAIEADDYHPTIPGLWLRWHKWWHKHLIW